MQVPNGGEADNYGVGDFWALRYRSGQIDDGAVATSTPGTSCCRWCMRTSAGELPPTFAANVRTTHCNRRRWCTKPTCGS